MGPLGVAVGGGWQGAWLHTSTCLAATPVHLGLPLGFIFGYLFRWDVQGIWAGMLSATAMQTAILMYMVCKTDWNAEAAQALERVRLWGGQHEHEKLPTSEQEDTIS
uniref:Protein DETOXIFICATION n=1 Tax=Leersia perrieri TaxID=77586 RepID=A0A0D9VMT7_9ORYZ